MSVDMFLEFDKPSGIVGESTDSQHKDTMQIDSFSFGVEVPTSVEQGTGLGSGKVKFNEFTFKSKASKASYLLYKNLTLGTHINQAKLYLRKAGGGSSTGQKDYMIYTFSNLIITKYAVDGGSEEPVEDLGFAYTALNVEYWQQDTKTGSVKRVGAWSYDVKTNSGS